MAVSGSVRGGMPGQRGAGALSNLAAAPGVALRKLAAGVFGASGPALPNEQESAAARDAHPLAHEAPERAAPHIASPRSDTYSAGPPASGESANTPAETAGTIEESAVLDTPPGGRRTSGGTSGTRQAAGGLFKRPVEAVRRAGARLRRALVLEFAGAKVVFNDVESFEFALASRTFLPANTLMALYARSAGELANLALKARLAEERLSEAIWLGMDKPHAMTRLIERLDPNLFSKDHDWRDLVIALMGKESAYDAFKRLALVNYLLYLASRQDALRSVYHSKTGETVFPHELDAPAGAQGDPAVPRQGVFAELLDRAMDAGTETEQSNRREPLIARALT